MAEVILEVNKKEINWELVNKYTGILLRLYYVNEERPEQVISSVDGQSKWRKGWFALVGPYMQMIIDEMKWVNEQEINEDDDVQTRSPSVHKTGEEIDWNREKKPVFPHLYERIIGMDTNNINFVDLYKLVKYWYRKDFNRSLTWKEDIDVGKKAIELLLSKFGINVSDTDPME